MQGLVALLVLLTLASCRSGSPSLGEPSAWSALPADGVAMQLSEDDGALRLDFRFTGGGWAIARREVALELPPDYAFRFRLRGEAPANHLELKLIDASGQNVWWHVWRDVEWPLEWQTFSARKRQIDFAWGPLGGGPPAGIVAIEFAVTAGEGGEGSIWIDGFELVERTVPTGPLPEPVAMATSAVEGHEAALAFDGDPATFWMAAAGDTAAGFTLDLGYLREFGGVTIWWREGRHATDYVVEASDDDGQSWRQLQAVVGSNGGRDDCFLPETEARRLRVRVVGGGATGGVAIDELVLQPLAWSASREAFLTDLAASHRRGLYPRGFVPEQVYWTVVGGPDDPVEGLLSEDGALEVGPGEFSIEPFLWSGGQLVTWADVAATQELVDGDLPLPRVVWARDPWRLQVEVVPVGSASAPALRATYVIANDGSTPAEATLFLAVRPFQVNPPSQFLNVRGGAATISAIDIDAGGIRVDDRPRVLWRERPMAAGATTFAAGDIVSEHLRDGKMPGATAVDDPFGAAGAAVAYRATLAAGAADTVAILALLGDRVPDGAWTDDGTDEWRRQRDRVRITGPEAAAEVLATLRAQLGYILVNRAGPAIQPGARSYARSWIRDGALTGEALLRLGHADAAVAFLEWYAPHQYDSGKIPCVVDRRGADPVPEHDSTGEFIHLVCECFRYTGDRELLERMWPRVLAGVAYLEALLAERRTDEYRGTEFFGILPPSISHEGYAAKPMHSYWDNFWTLRGLRDAIWMAGQLGSPEASRLVALHDRFAADFGASVAAAMQRHGIDYVPGCADLGDFDPTSTTMALAPAAAEGLLPAGSLERTFERYWDFFAGRRDGEPWEVFTPYELRNVGAFVRLGWRERAEEALAWFLTHRRPAGWRHWAEVVARDERGARFIGDMPHTWVGSDFVRSVLDMFVHEQRDEAEGGTGGSTLVLAAGLPPGWLLDGGVQVAGLPTPWGPLSYSLRREGAVVVMDIAGGLRAVEGGLDLRPAVDARSVTVDGAPVAMGADGRVRIATVPARVVWRD